MTSAPVLTDNDIGHFFFKKSRQSQKVKELQSTIKKLKELDALTGRKALKSSTDKEKVLSELVSLLQSSDVAQMKMFIYDDFL